MKLGMKNMGNALDEGKVILKRLDDEVIHMNNSGWPKYNKY